MQANLRVVYYTEKMNFGTPAPLSTGPLWIPPMMVASDRIALQWREAAALALRVDTLTRLANGCCIGAISSC